MNLPALLPTIEDTDSSDTRWALETARTLWGQSERREALQWVRRAAESAAEAGQDDRAAGRRFHVRVGQPRVQWE